MTEFKKRDREATLIYQNVDPEAVMDADHIHPKSKGGDGDVANLQFLDPAANRAKADHTISLRGWQQDFLVDWDRSTEESFLCVVIPGGGKTRGALYAAHRFLQAGHDRRLLIVGPTVNVRRQWETEALSLLGLKLQTKEFGTNFKSGFMGGVATYSMLASSAALFRKICATAPTLAILDEPHHLTESAAWGDCARHALELATRRLLLSGTPFRTDGRPIPFVRYDGGGVCVTDFRYDYPNALKDTVVRTLVFDYSQGSYEELFLGARRSLDFNGELSESDASERLRQILNPGGDFVAQMIRLAHAKLTTVRQAIPDAGAMAVCIDMNHAQRIADVIRRETGCRPSIVVSDDEIAIGSVEEYRRCRSEWLVSVRQVTEGTDIKRLHVLCYLTNATTELIFRQLIGRISRVRYQDPDTPKVSDEAQQSDLEAYVFLPADPRLIGHAKNIEAAQLRALREISDQPERDTHETIEDARVRVFLGSTHTGTDLLLVGGRSYSADEADRIRRIAAHGVKMETAAKIFDAEIRGVTPTAHSEPQSGLTEEDRIDALRRRCNKIAYAYAKTVGVDIKEVHGQWPRQATMGLEALDRKYQRLLVMLAEARSC
jgi:superfamily II DNA or RNA helicase